MVSAIQKKVNSWRQSTWGDLLSEFIGTFVLIALGNGVVGLAVVGMYGSGRAEEIFVAAGDWMIIGWGGGLAVAFGVYIAGGVCGAHLDAAATSARAVSGMVASG